jgi:PAS domain S-box-containing protein/putative nucleotidyltransferase with HDIG domain
LDEQPLTILLVEDNLDHIELARRVFELVYPQDRFFACTTLREAEHWLQEHQVDVLIADLHLPDGSGLDLLQHPYLNGQLPAVIITNQGDEQHAVQAMRSGAMDYLVKGNDTFRHMPAIAHRVYGQWRVIEAKRLAEEKLRQHEALLNAILQSARDGYILLDADGKFLEVNRAYAELVGYEPDELMGKTIAEIEALQSADQIAATLEGIRRTGSALFETCHRHRDGRLIEVEVSVTHLPEQGGKMVTFVRNVEERKAIQRRLHKRERQLATLYDTAPVGIYYLVDSVILECNRSFCQMTGYREDEVLGENARFLYPTEEEYERVGREKYAQIAAKGSGSLETQWKKKDGSIIDILLSSTPLNPQDWQKGVVATALDITGYKQLIASLEQARKAVTESEERLQKILAEIPAGVVIIESQSGRFEYVNRAFCDMIGYEACEVIGKDALALNLFSEASFYDQLRQDFWLEKRFREVEITLIHRNGEPRQALVSAHLITYHGEDHLLAVITEITERVKMEKALFEAKAHIERQLEEMTILRNIDLAITAHQEIQGLTETLLEQLSRMRGISAVCWMTQNASQDGWAIQASFPKGLNCQIKQLLERLPIDLERLSLQRQALFLPLSDGIGSCLPKSEAVAVLPLILHEQLWGALLLFAEHEHTFDAAGQDFAQAIAIQTTIALENAYLYEALSQHHQELLEAYQATLSAWSRTLEIRDKETEGHTQRVVELGLKLARAFGFAAKDLEVFRRGALLHDIGKIRVPDSILLKPTQLDPKEWEVMRQHPLYAREMVRGIRILEEALEIPLYHHEWWDGNGYPFGLKGEEIPLAARIFAVVDVWDALTSDRPYRPAWTREAARTYIANHAGRQFDPKVVEQFLKLLDAGEVT